MEDISVKRYEQKINIRALFISRVTSHKKTIAKRGEGDVIHTNMDRRAMTHFYLISLRKQFNPVRLFCLFGCDIVQIKTLFDGIARQ